MAGLLTAGAVPARAESECRADITEADAYDIRSFDVEARWPPPLELPRGRYSPAKVSEAIGLVKEALDRERGIELAAVGAISLGYIDSCTRVLPEATCLDATGNPAASMSRSGPGRSAWEAVGIDTNLLELPARFRGELRDMARHPARCRVHCRPGQSLRGEADAHATSPGCREGATTEHG
jgi:hypothetical protein